MSEKIINWYVKSYIKEGQDKGKVLLILHGYQQNALWIHSKLKDRLSFSGDIIALDAPIPLINEQNSGEGERKYAWYLFNPSNSTYITPMSFAVNYIFSFLQKENIEKKEFTILGYSQGGYLVPFLAEKISSKGIVVKKVIGVNSRFRSESIEGKLPFEFDAINGAKDQVVDPERSAKCHQEIMQVGNKGKFYLIEGVGHGLSEAIIGGINTSLEK